MSNSIAVILAAMLGGIAVVVQASINGMMDKGMGTVERIHHLRAWGLCLTILGPWEQNSNP